MSYASRRLNIILLSGLRRYYSRLFLYASRSLSVYHPYKERCCLTLARRIYPCPYRAIVSLKPSRCISLEVCLLWDVLHRDALPFLVMRFTSPLRSASSSSFLPCHFCLLLFLRGNCRCLALACYLHIGRSRYSGPIVLCIGLLFTYSASLALGIVWLSL